MNFLEKHFVKIVIAFMLITFVQQCGNSRRLGTLEKQAKITNNRLDSISTKVELEKTIKLEGLKSEMRMIQSTDRKIIDVNRQSELDAEIKKLESSN